jgi:hypothetical protein
MKKILLALTGFTLLSFAFIDFYEEINITQEKAKECLFKSISSGNLVTEGDIVSKTKNLPVDIRVAGIKQLMQLAREYTATEEFASSYKKWRNAKLNPDEKTRLGLPKLGKMVNNKIDNMVDKDKHEKIYPSDPSELIKKRLEYFLSISSTVDFDAELANGRFTNREYEAKSSHWKMCYRAGKEVVAAARTEAKKWLKDFE